MQEEKLVWDDTEVGDHIWQIFMRDVDIDNILDRMLVTYPNGLDLDVFEKHIHEQIVKFVPVKLMITDLIREEKGYKLWFKDKHAYFIPLEEFFTEGDLHYHSREILAPSEDNINSLGMIYVGVSKDILYDALIDNLYEEYDITINNQWEVDFEND